MSKKFLFIAALLVAPLSVLTPLAAWAAAPAAVQAGGGPAMPGSPDAVLGRDKGGKLAGLLSPEQRAMFMLQARDATRDMSQDQRKAWRKDQMQKVMTMSQTDRVKFKTDLQVKWDALPQGQKDRIQQRLAAREQNRAAQ